MINKKAYVEKYDAWTTRISVDPFAVPLTELLAKTPITPNQVTVLSFLISLVSAYFFLKGSRTDLVWGAIIWHIAFIFDGSDGMLARKTDRTSPFGAKLDSISDKIKKILNLAALMYPFRGNQYIAVMITLLVVHYVLHYVPVKQNAKIQGFLHSKGIKSLFDPLDEQLFLLFLGPLTGRVYVFIIATVGLQVINKLMHLICNLKGVQKQ